MVQTIINYELGITASQNQGHQGIVTQPIKIKVIRVIKKIMVQTKSCYKHGSQTSSLQTRMREV